MFNVNKVICELLEINQVSFEALLSKGMRPVKAAVRLGANRIKAEVLSGLKVEWSIEGINKVYADENILSCMTDQKVGDFYYANNIGVMYGNNFRMLVNKQGSIAKRAYGYKGQFIRDLLLNSENIYAADSLFPCNVEYQAYVDSIYSGYYLITATIKPNTQHFQASWFMNDAPLSEVYGKDTRYELIEETIERHQGKAWDHGDNYDYLVSHSSDHNNIRTVVYKHKMYTAVTLTRPIVTPIISRPDYPHFVPYVDECGGFPHAPVVEEALNDIEEMFDNTLPPPPPVVVLDWDEDDLPF